MQFRRLFCLLVLGTFLFSFPIYSKNSDQITIPLKINIEYEPGAYISFIKSVENQEILYFKEKDGNYRMGTAPGGVKIKIKKLNNKTDSFSIVIDADGDGDFSKEAAKEVSPKSPISFNILRKWENGKKMVLPYQIHCAQYKNEKGKIESFFYWAPHYRAEGVLNFNNCNSFFALTDINGDGIFDGKDFSRATTVFIDQDNDGKTEVLMGNQIIKFCNEYFLIDSLEPDGSQVILKKTTLTIPQIGKPLPNFELVTEKGEIIKSENIKGKIYLIDFWASWCQICIKKFPFIKKTLSGYKNKIEVIAINVDNASRLNRAREIVKEYELPWIHVMTGKGTSDPLWKMFGSMNNNRLSAPLYVLIDPKGIIRYAGHGGKDLSDLVEKISQLVKE